MSEREFKRRRIAKEVMRKAWYTYKHCMLSWRTCLIICWKTVRFMLPVRHSKARGTTFGNRQDVLKRLSLYSPTEISLYFERESNNDYDRNAIRIMASVRNRGEALVGYVSRELSAAIAPLLDSGHEAAVIFNTITGSGIKGRSYGLNFDYVLL